MTDTQNELEAVDRLLTRHYQWYRRRQRYLQRRRRHQTQRVQKAMAIAVWCIVVLVAVGAAWR